MSRVPVSREVDELTASCIEPGAKLEAAAERHAGEL